MKLTTRIFKNKLLQFVDVKIYDDCQSYPDNKLFFDIQCKENNLKEEILSELDFELSNDDALALMKFIEAHFINIKRQRKERNIE